MIHVIAKLKPSKRAFTLVELLTVIGIVSILLSLLLPAIQAAREAARRVVCLANLSQIGKAMHNYASAWDGFPSGSQGYLLPASTGLSSKAVYPSPLVAILQYLDQQILFDSLNFAVPLFDLTDLEGPHFTSSHTKIGLFLCPSDGNSYNGEFGRTNYRACLGECEACPMSGHAAFSPENIERFAAFTDGLSNTMAFSEKLTGSLGRYSANRDWLDLGGSSMLTGDSWSKLCSEQVNPSLAQYNSGATWMIAGGAFTHFYTATNPNSKTPDCGSDFFNLGYGAFAARSNHAGGVQALMCDGSARFIVGSITTFTWRAIGTKNGNESFDADSF